MDGYAYIMTDWRGQLRMFCVRCKVKEVGVFIGVFAPAG